MGASALSGEPLSPDTLTAAGTGVCLATTAATPGGVWRHLCDLADGLSARGIGVRVAISADAVGLHADARRRGYETGGRRFEREVFHAHLGNTYDRVITLAMLRARAAGARVVLTEHLPRSDASDARLADRAARPGARATKTLLKRAQFALADRVIAVSSGSAGFLTERYGLTSPSLVTVVNGVAVDDPAPAAAPPGPAGSSSYGPHLVATGAVIAQKGFDLLIAAGRLAERDWRVDVYGTGPHLRDLQASAASLRLADGTARIAFHGWTDDVRARVTAADALVMPSRWEALPYSALEAMAWARPVIATAVDGLSEVVVPGVTGILVGVDAAALAAALDAFSRDRSAAAAMGAAGRERVAISFRLDTMVDATAEVYRQCLPGTGVPGTRPTRVVV